MKKSRAFKWTKRLQIFLVALLSLGLLLTGCQKQGPVAGANGEPTGKTSTQDFTGRTLTLVTTTSTENSGLLDGILPDFKAQYHCDVKVVAVGSGAAFEMAKKGDADVILVHAPKSEEQFMTDGFGRVRVPLMYNDFVLVGPGDLTNLGIQDKKDILGALKGIQSKGLKFVSRGDDSGTHKKELELWKKAEITPTGDHYLSVGKGMGEVLTMADELQAYTIADRATYLSMAKKLSIKVLVEGDKALYNPYAVISISKDKFPKLNHDMADAFLAWLTSDQTKAKIADFGKAEYGQPLFYLLEK